MVATFRSPSCSTQDLRPTFAMEVFRLLMAIVANFDLETIQLDVVNAFLNSELPYTYICAIHLLENCLEWPTEPALKEI